MDEEAALRVEELLARSDWIRALAVSLARDPDDGEDLAQSTLAIALEKQPGEGVPPRRWLAAVMRNLLRQDLRSARRRERRERRVARSEIVPSDVELLERLEIQRKVVDAVRALDEPYRSAILRRYFEGLAPTEIARQTDVPLRTVHTRLNRGLHSLRQRLDAELGDRGSWIALLLPLVSGKAGSLGAGGIIVSQKMWIGAGLAVAAFALIWCVQSVRPADVRPVVPGITTDLEGAKQPEASTPSRSEDSTSSVRPSIEASGTAPSPPPPRREYATLRGLVVDGEGHPRSDVGVFLAMIGESSFGPRVRPASTGVVGPGKVRFQATMGAGRGVAHVDHSTGSFSLNFLPDRSQSPARGRGPHGERIPVVFSDDDGRFELSRVGDGSMLYGSDLRSVPVLAFDYYANDPGSNEPLVVVAEPAAVSGIVVDEQGRPLGGVEVSVRPPESLKSSLGRVLVRAELLEYFDITDERGGFRIQDAPGVRGRSLRLSRASDPIQSQDIPEQPTTDLRIVLQSDVRKEARGIVVDAEGKHVPFARVRFAGTPDTRAGLDGRFTLDVSHAKAGDTIFAAKPEFTPGREPYEPSAAEIRIRIGPPLLRLSGRVVDEAGRPMKQVGVRLFDPMVVDALHLEAFASGDGKEAPASWCATKEDGSFELGGLGPRAYVLSLEDGRTLRAMLTDPIEAGQHDLELRFHFEDPVGHVAGTVVDLAGQPVRSARVLGRRSLLLSRDGPVDELGFPVLTEVDGRFDLREVPLDLTGIQVTLFDGLPFVHPIEPGQDLEHLCLVAYRQAYFQVVLADPDLKADAITMLDALGRPMPIARHEGAATACASSWPIHDGRTEGLATLEAAQTLVLRRGAEEVRRIPIRLAPGELTILRP